MAGSIKDNSPNRGTIYRAIFLFGLLNGLILLLNGRPYLPSAPAQPAEMVYKYTAFVSHFIFLCLLLIALLCFLYALVRVAVAAKFLSIVFFTLVQVIVFVDARIFTHFKFHLSGIVFSAMTTPGYWDSMHFSPKDWVFFLLALLTLILSEALLFTAIYRTLSKKKRLWRATRLKYALLLAGLVIILTLGEKIAYGISDLYGYTPITRYEKILPFYRPITFKKMFENHLQVESKIGEKLIKAGSESQLNYPLPGFRFEPLPRPYHVIILVVESLRFDMLSEEVMPNLSAFCREATLCTYHYSGGNTSRFGGFSLIYGLYGTYWHQAYSHRQGPVLIKQLIHNNYLFKVMSSTSLSFPEFKQTLFADISTEIEDHLPGKDSAERDEALVDSYLNWLKTVNRNRPFFTFIFLDCPHTTYFFKEQFRKFEPCCEEISFIKTDLEGHREEIFNRYRNAIHYADYSLGRIFKTLKEQGFLEDSLIVVTGDHGQEFWECGYYGHNSSYDDYQTRVPLAIRIPDGKRGSAISKVTCHFDLPTTILSALGDRNDPALYSLGNDIFGPEQERFLILSGWDDCCLLTPRLKMRFSTEAYNFFESEVTDLNDRPVTDKALIREERSKYLLPALEGMGKFLR